MPIFPSKKPDGVVEVVHYGPDGQVAWVRAYERRGPTYTDQRLLTRAELVERLKAGKRFFAGWRIPYRASTFHTHAAVRLHEHGGRELLLTDDHPTDRDDLTGIPII